MVYNISKEKLVEIDYNLRYKLIWHTIKFKHVWVKVLEFYRLSS